MSRSHLISSNNEPPINSLPPRNTHDDGVKSPREQHDFIIQAQEMLACPGLIGPEAYTVTSDIFANGGLGVNHLYLLSGLGPFALEINDLEPTWFPQEWSASAFQGPVDAIGPCLSPVGPMESMRDSSLPGENMALQNISAPQAPMPEETAVIGGIQRLQITTDAMRAARDLRRKKRARFHCHICLESFTTIHSRRRHLDAHYGIRYKCRYCGATFGTRGDCRRHEMMKHHQ